MAFTPWKTLSSKVLIKYRKWDYMEDMVELPNGRQSNYQYIKSDGASIIIPVDADGKLTVIRQYRYLIGGESLEFPAGLVEDGLSPLETAHKELAEEVGLKAGSMEYVGKGIAATGCVQAYNHIFVARDLSEAETDLEDTEQIEVLKMTPQEFDVEVAAGKVMASHILIAWAIARHKLLS